MAAFAVAALASAGQASAATTTIGQTAPDPYTYTYTSGYYYYDYDAPAAVCDTPRDLLQSTVSGGAQYVVPAKGIEVRSWRTNAAVGAGQTATLKVFRKIAEPSTYEVVAHDGPRNLTPGTANGGTMNTFSSLAIPVQPGDLIGLYTNAGTVNGACLFPASGTFMFSSSSLGDGASASFASSSGSRLNLSAVVELEASPGTPQHTLTIERAGGGHGSVQSTPAGIDACAASCSHAFNQGTVVTLAATPDGYSSFAGWSGGGCSGQGACQVTVGSDVTVTATFEKSSYDYGSSAYGPPSSQGSPPAEGGGPLPATTGKCRKPGAGKARGRTGKAGCAKRARLVTKRLRNAGLGMDILATKKGRTLYTLSSEHGNAFFCTSTCLSAWPPLKVPAGIRPAGPVKLGTARRPEGGVQVTHRGRPLYTFSGDTLPGDANGHGIADASGTWKVVPLPPPKR